MKESDLGKYPLPLHITPTSKYRKRLRIWKVTEAFAYESAKYGRIDVPKGTITDLASVPPCLQAIFPKDGRYLEAAVVHDHMYQEAIMTKREADLVLREGMKVLGVKPWRRFFIYWGCRLFGKGSYK